MNRTASDPPINDTPTMQRTDLLIAALAFGAAVSSLMAWMWSAFAPSAGDDGTVATAVDERIDR
jgi:hypothetical protein